MKDFQVYLREEWEVASWTRRIGKGNGRFLFQEEGTAWEKAWTLEISCFVRCVLSNGDRQEHGLCDSKGGEHNLYSEQGPDYELWPLKDVAGQV